MNINARFPSRRRAEYIAVLGRGESVSATGFAAQFGVSEAAVRRDLRQLAAEGLCRRVYGGAVPLSPASTSIATRLAEVPRQKTSLARAALTWLRPNQTIFIDNGSTNVLFAEILPKDLALTVVTHSIPVAVALMGRSGVETFVIGGRLDPHIGANLSTRAVSDLNRQGIDLCLLGICAIATDGAAAFNAEDAELKRELLNASSEVAVLVTNGKLQTAAPHRVASLSALTYIVVEHDAPSEVLTKLRSAGASIVIAQS
jgi:DeoR/GlpR family transcriptional regulator of sugar metabolism